MTVKGSRGRVDTFSTLLYYADMKRLLVSLLVLGLVSTALMSSCFPAQGRTTWTKADGTEEGFRKDNALCENQALVGHLPRVSR